MKAAPRTASPQRGLWVPVIPSWLVLAASVTDERSGVDEPVWMAEQKVGGFLGSPRTGRVGGDAGEEHFSGGDVDEEQQIVTAQQSGIDSGEVAGDGCLRA